MGKAEENREDQDKGEKAADSSEDVPNPEPDAGENDPEYVG